MQLQPTGVVGGACNSFLERQRAACLPEQERYTQQQQPQVASHLQHDLQELPQLVQQQQQQQPPAEPLCSSLPLGAGGTSVKTTVAPTASQLLDTAGGRANGKRGDSNGVAGSSCQQQAALSIGRAGAVAGQTQLLVDKRKAVRAMLGVRMVWVSAEKRRTGLATKLLDAAR